MTPRRQHRTLRVAAVVAPLAAVGWIAWTIHVPPLRAPAATPDLVVSTRTPESTTTRAIPTPRRRDRPPTTPVPRVAPQGPAVAAAVDEDGASPTPDPAEDARLLAEIEALIADLADDTIPENATRAHDTFVFERRYPRRLLQPALERALYSADHQQRHLAAELVRRLVGFSQYDENDAAPLQLARVSVEALYYDRLPADPHSHPGPTWTRAGRNEASAAAWLIRRRDDARRVWPELRSALTAADGQARFLAAVVLAASGATTDTARLVPILVPHLRDNDIPSDANLAGFALAAIGPSVLPHLDALGDHAIDRQARGWLERVRADIASAERIRRTRPAFRRDYSDYGMNTLYLDWGDAMVR